jgi:hypothetical protein
MYEEEVRFWTPSGIVTLFDASLLTFEPQLLRLFFCPGRGGRPWLPEFTFPPWG